MRDYSTVKMNGTYTARAVKAEWKTYNGIDFVGVEFKLAETGETVSWSGWVGGSDPNKNRWTVASLRLMGCTSDDPQNLDGFGKNEVRIRVGNVEKDGKIKTRVFRIKSVDDCDDTEDGISVPSNVSQYKDLWKSVPAEGVQKSNAARLPDMYAQKAKPSAKKFAEPAVAAPSQDFGDDDIPF